MRRRGTTPDGAGRRQGVRLAALLLAVGALGCAAGPRLAPGTPEPLAEVLRAMPAPDAGSEARLTDRLLGFDDANLLWLFDLLATPGSDSDRLARFALGSLGARAAVDPEAGARFEPLLLQVLAAAPDKASAAFVVELLAGTGSDSAVDALGPLALDESLGDHAVAALTRIGTEPAREALRQALSEVPPSRRVAVIAGLGELHDMASVDAIFGFVDAAEPMVRLAVIRTLSRLAPAELASPLLRAAQQERGYRRDRALGALLGMAERLAETGAVEPATALARGLAEEPNEALRHGARSLLERLSR